MRSTTPWSRSPRSLLRQTGLACAALLAIGLATGAAQAAPVVTFTATDLVDVSVGTDLWKYDFTIEGSAAVFESVNLLFDSGLYANLAASSSSADLQLLVTEPDPGLPADGQVLATLLTALGAPQSLSVEFSWLGSAAPGLQPYQYLDEGFAELAVLDTRRAGAAVVPEPGMLPALLAIAGLATWVQRRRAAGRG